MSRIIVRSLISVSRRTNCILTKARDIGTSDILRNNVKLPKPPKRREFKLTWESVIIILSAGGILLMYIFYLKDKKDRLREVQMKKYVGKASIGGYFELVDPSGNLVKATDLLGQWLLIYFGFTHCPDICPDELNKLSRVVDILEEKYKLKVQPVFITVDPERDTPALVGKYVKEFSNKILGLSGTHEQIQKACKVYRVYFSSGPKNEESDYLVDHSIITYFMDPKGEFVEHYGQNVDVAEMVGDIRIRMLKYQGV